MCTLTFIPQTSSTFITHSRDEKRVRSKASFPQATTINGKKLLFPRDGEAGGSWIAMNENGDTAVLLNGGFVKHIPAPPYRRSRGLCFLDIATAEDLFAAYDSIDLDKIEPFTIILYTHNKELRECRWDGQTKWVKDLDASMPHIWSSATLYDEEVAVQRKWWFESWMQINPQPDLQDILQFHLSGGEGDLQNGVRMNRGDVLLTVSITAMQVKQDIGIMRYLDLQEQQEDSKEIKFIDPVSGVYQAPSYISLLP